MQLKGLSPAWLVALQLTSVESCHLIKLDDRKAGKEPKNNEREKEIVSFVKLLLA